MPTSGEISLYFHVPFCSRKCDYCHFYVLPDKDYLKQQLMTGLALEWDLWKPQLKGHQLVSIYFGGGTPSLLGPERIGTIIDWVYTAFPARDIEITLEANPEHITQSLMRAYAAIGINRVSLGVQSFDDTLLQRLSRQHNAQTAIKAVEDTAAVGISNISIDLMYDLPNQSVDQWEKSIAQAVALPVTHLSLYNLTIEPHTVFFKYRQELQTLLPSAENSLRMYEIAQEEFEKGGLHQYEISAFARDGLYSRHNVGYWTGRSFIGFGPSAFSDWKGSRFRNIAHLGKYVEALEARKSPIDFSETLLPDARRRELFVLQLRLMKGVDIAQFEATHGALDEETHLVCQQLCDKGWLKGDSRHHLSLTRSGILFYDSVAAELV